VTGRYERLVEQAPEGIVVHDGERILEVNGSLVKLVGATSREQLIGQPVSTLLEHPYLRAVSERLRAISPTQDIPVTARDRLHRVDGGARDVEVRTQLFLEHGVPYAHLMLYDITDRLAAERALAEQAERMRTEEKLEKIRALAGGVAHEINNMLQIVLGFADVLTEGPLSRGQRADVDEIIRAASRGVTIIQQLLQFSRQALCVPRVVDLGETVRSIADGLVAGTADRPLSMSEAGGAIPPVRVDPGNLRQMLEYLVANADRATRRHGTITISVQGQATSRALDSSDGRPIPPGEYGTVSVHDTGIGMTPEVQRHVFEPFFTTAAVGEAAGLGLSAVQGLVALNGGFLTCESAPSAGTVFTLWLPAAVAER
jgi:two-component system, cell cycle sensor histidine kinase and response regulator CckA